MKVWLASYAEHQTTKFDTDWRAAEFVCDTQMQQKYLCCVVFSYDLSSMK